MHAIRCGRGMRTSFPKMRAPVETCTTARATAAVANHAFPAIVEEKTDVMFSASAFTLAELHLAKPGPAQVRVGPARGRLPWADGVLDCVLQLPRRGR